MRLNNKVAIVTGGARGIGRSTVKAFCREGAKTVIADIDVQTGIETAKSMKAEGFQVEAIRTDISSESSVNDMVSETIKLFGGVDILVNNASILAQYTAERGKGFCQITAQEWDQTMNINLRGPFFCCKSVVPIMKERGGGKIINLASTTFFWGAPNIAQYVTSKGGIIGFSRSIARELGPFKINVNCVAPGSTLSEETENKEAMQFRESAIPRRSIPRVEYPDDLVGAIVFLASPESDFVTGQTIVIDGGHVMH